jgi:hypothetical protein
VKLPTALIFELRRLVEAIQEESRPARSGPIVVSGMLCEQLARELGADAEPGAVVVDGGTRGGAVEVLVHVMAGEPSPADEALVRAADRDGVPVVLVQLWPQERWTPPFVLTPFVVECEAGKGFPVDEIARRIADATESWTALARRVPVLHDVVSSKVVRTSMIRSALAGAASRKGESARPVLALEQARMVARLRSLRADRSDELPVVAGAAAAAVAFSFVLRAVARKASDALPAPLVDAAVAASATWAIAEAARRIRLPE